jgi:RHS repeat-associated protein
MRQLKILLLITLFSTISNASIEVTSGKYIVSEQDLSVKIIGGYLTWERSYRGKNWYFNREWEPLIFNIDNATGKVESILKANDLYIGIDSEASLFKYGKTRTIKKQSDGSYTWKDRNGHRTHYDTSGKILSVHLQSDVKITFTHNIEGKINGAYDVNDFQVFWIDYDPNSGNVSKVRDYTNREVLYNWIEIVSNLPENKFKLEKVTDSNLNEWIYEYSNAAGSDGLVNLIKVTSPENQVENINYSSSGRVTSVADGEGNKKSFHFEYIKSRKEFYIKTTSLTGKTVETWYRRNGELNRKDVNGITVLTKTKDLRKDIEKDIYGRVTTREYDEFDNLLKTTYSDGKSEEYTYDITTSKILTYKNANNVLNKYEYDNFGNLKKSIEAFGSNLQREIDYTYDEYGQRKSFTMNTGVDSQTVFVQYFYDNFGNLIKEIDSKGLESIYTHNSQGNRITAESPRKKQWDFEYDNNGNLTQAKSPLDHITKFEFNSANLLTKKIHADQSFISYTYNKLNRPITEKNELGAIATDNYDVAGRIQKTISFTGSETQFEYDLIGRLKKVILPGGDFILYVYPQNSFEIGYGSFFNPIEIIYPTYTAKLKYDLRGRVIQESKHYLLNGQSFVDTQNVIYDGLDNIIEISGDNIPNKKFIYDDLNRLTSLFVNDNLEQYFEYDLRNFITLFKDANGKEFKYRYDLNGNKISELSPMGREKIFTYDDNNNLKSTTDAIGNKIEYSYDDDDRKIKEEVFDTNQSLQQSINYTLNSRGSIEHYDNGISNANYSYNHLQQVTSKTINFENQTYTHQYKYYNNGLKKSFIGVDSTEYSFFYNNKDTIQNIIVPNEGNISYSNFIWNQPQTVSYPSGISKTLTYDGLEKIRSISVKDNTNADIQNQTFQYNNFGLISQITTMQGLHEFNYDDKQRITNATHPTLPNETWEYDNGGNRIKDSSTGDNIWNYNDDNQLVDSITNKFGYDDDGNLTHVYNQNSELLYSYQYNESGQIKYLKDSNGNPTFEYIYDPFGFRISKKNLIDNLTTYFHYADEGLVYESNSLNQEVNYLYLPSTDMNTQPVLKRAANKYYYYLNDHIGTPQKIIDNSGIIQLATEYSIFGKSNDYLSINNHSNRLGFVGQYSDLESGLNYNVQRYFNPDLGRYIQKDPLGVLQDFHEYNYAFNNPLEFIDPYGELSLSLCKKIGLGKKGIAKAGAKACISLEIRLEGRCINTYLCISGGINVSAGGGDLGVKPSVNLKVPIPPPTPKPPPKPDDPKKKCFTHGAKCGGSASAGTSGFSLGGGCNAKACRLIDTTCKQCFDCYDEE